jgi:two-component system chemotaxis sensor kinase CheA
VGDLTGLRKQIDGLALWSATEEPGAGSSQVSGACKSAIEQIQDSAAREGAEALARSAAAVLAGIAAAEGSGAALPLDEGIARLQAALEADAGKAAPPLPSLAADPELLTDFILECREHLAEIEAQVLALEREGASRESLDSMFRGFHTIKGLAGFLELKEIQKISHEVESILDRARNGQLALGEAATDAILETADYLRKWLAHLDSELRGESSQPPGGAERLIARIAAASSGASETPAADASQPSAPPERAEPAAAPETGAAKKKETAALRVDTAKLDYLVDMAGEMVIAESLVRHNPELASLKSPGLQRNLAQLTRITAELQKTAMAMRLVPIGPLFRKMARLVRDLSKQVGKTVEMETEGDEIELDRQIVEELADPLMHMVRNSIDHGLETPDERVQKGKPAAGKLLLRGRHHAGQVVIEITDDGRGLDREKIAAKAIQKGMIATAEGMADNDVYNLIFQPGFTTAAKVTNVSGRGVGMDVVRRHIEKLRGRIEIRSAPGQGATFLLKLPLTLAIIDGLVVAVGSERYVAPIFQVREMLRPAADTMWTVQQRAEMALIRGELVPVLRLYRRFNVVPRSEDPLQGALLVAEVDGRRFGILVDELLGKQEVVIKSLGPTFAGVAGIAGGAILGDGRVGLILDLERLVKDGLDESSRV